MTRPTRDQLADRVAELEALLRDEREARRELARERDELEAKKLPDREAEALDGCLKALKALVSAPPASGSTYGWPSHHNAVRRILLFLADFHSVALVDPPPPVVDEAATRRRVRSILQEIDQRLEYEPLA